MTEMVERMADAIYWKFEDRPKYAQLQMNGVLALELAMAALEAMREIGEVPGPRYTAGEYSRRNIEAFIDDALQNSPVAR